MYIFIVLILIIFFVVYWYFNRNKHYWAERNVPMIEIRWFFGSFKKILLGRRHFGLFFQDIYKAFPEAAYVGYLKLRQPGILLRDPKIIQSVLTSNFSNFSENDIHIDKKIDFLFGNNPFVLKGEEWKRARGHFTPAITTSRLKTYFPGILTVCRKLVKYIGDNIKDNGLDEFEAKELANTYTTDVIANAVFSVETNSFVDPNNLFVRITRNLFESSFLNNLKTIALFIHPCFATIFGLRFTSKECEDAVLSMTRKVLAYRKETSESGNDFFQQMINYRENDKIGEFTDQYIASHCFEFLVDGIETTGDVLCFTLFELAWHKEVQEKLRQEIEDVLQKNGGDVTYEMINELNYLDRVLSEVLRMHPPAMVITRLCTKNYQIPNGVEIERGSSVAISVYGLHMDPQYYPEPHKFDPERFTPDAVAAREKFVYLPFGEGPRICLGMKFAHIQLKAAIINLVKNYRLRPSARSSYPLGIDPKVIIKRPLNGAYVCFQKL